MGEVQYPEEDQQKIDEFCAVTGLSDKVTAAQFLKSASWNLPIATNRFYEFAGDSTAIASLSAKNNVMNAISKGNEKQQNVDSVDAQNIPPPSGDDNDEEPEEEAQDEK